MNQRELFAVAAKNVLSEEPEVAEKASKFLDEFINDPQSLDICVNDVIPSTLVTEELSVAASVVLRHLKTRWYVIDFPKIENIFRTLERRIFYGLKKFPDNVYAILLKCESMLTLHFPNYFEFWPEFPPDNRIIYLNGMFEELEGNVTYCFRQIAYRLSTASTVIFDTLSKANSHDSNWLKLLNYGIIWCGITDFVYLTDKLKISLGRIDVLPQLIMLLETLSDFDPSSKPFIAESCDMLFCIVLSSAIESVMKMIDEIKSKLPNPFEFGSNSILGAREILRNHNSPYLQDIISRIQTPSYILSILLNFSTSFWIKHSNELSDLFNLVFDSFSLLSFSPNEFLDLAYLFSQFLFTFIDNNDVIFISYNLQKIKTDFISLLINTADAGEEFLCPKLSQCFHLLTSTDDFTILSFLQSQIFNPSPGFYFAVGSSLHSKIIQGSRVLYNKLESLKEDFPAILLHPAALFLKSAAVELTNVTFSAMTILNNLFVYSLANKDMKGCLLITDAIYHYAIACPISFHDHFDDYISTMIHWSLEIPFPITINILRTFFVLVSIFSSPEMSQSKPNVPRLLQAIDSPISALIAQSHTEEELILIVKTLSKLMDEYIKDFEKDGIKDKDMNNYCHHIFDLIWNSWEPIQDRNDDIIQEYLCTFIQNSIKSHWVKNEVVVQWLERVLQLHPIPEHVMILEQLLESNDGLNPMNNIISFLQSIPSLTNPDLVYEILRFAQIAFMNQWPPFFDVFTIEMICGPLTANYPSLVDQCLDTIKMMMFSRKELISTKITIVIKLIISPLLNQFNESQAIKAVSILLVIRHIHFDDLPNYLESILSEQIHDPSEAKSFCHSFRLESSNEAYSLLKATMTMVINFRESKLV